MGPSVAAQREEGGILERSLWTKLRRAKSSLLIKLDEERGML